VGAYLAALPADAKKEAKRKAEPKPKPNAKKLKKAEGGDGGDGDDGDGDGLDWAAIKADGLIAKQTVPALKAFLRARGLPVGGKKAELVERAEEALAL